MPSHPLTLELLEETGPLAVSSANLTGQPAAETARQALDMLGDSSSVYLDAGPVGSGYERRPGANTGSTIVDATGASDGVAPHRPARRPARLRDQRVVGADALA